MRVVFDIGHGSDTYPRKEADKGVGNFAEHSFNSAVAMRAKLLAEKLGFEVLLPQPPNAPEVSLNKRCNWINAEHKKDPILCLVSFHADNGSEKSSGWSVFHWHTSTRGKLFAQLWAKHATELLPIPAKGVRECVPGTWSNFGIVRKPVMPCILAEHFYFSNPEELRKCNTPEYIDLAAQVTVRALDEYSVIISKEIIQEACGFSEPAGIWKYMDMHPHASSWYRKTARPLQKIKS